LKRHTLGLGEAIAADTRPFLTCAFVFHRKTLALDPIGDDFHRRLTLSSHAAINKKSGGAARPCRTIPVKDDEKFSVKFERTLLVFRDGTAGHLAPVEMQAKMQFLKI